ncbi:tRNA1(Val) (adenine(37)-N6)-methyltransferase [Robertkochia solimangrovi]|uniref:tRNA1(Val) (adenine(37)-N6)-methyltransferase n=1 Tax=Robertkochia solimangrovi TaxID=2213046 RepID=UPI001F551AA7|nr:methyltransferase [Robertkochia solimangrovi]
MKVGTDGVLLGAWADLSFEPLSILDIGAGTGLVSLMMAQRCGAELIDALEIDPNAYEQCVENFEASDWGDRLFCYHAGFDEFVMEMDEPYDLIISNPPFYAENVSASDKVRDLARANASLPFPLLIGGAARLLTEAGRLNIIIPFKEEENITGLASQCGLFPSRICRVKGNPEAPVKRSLMEFSFVDKTPVYTSLIIEEERHEFTEDYISLTKDFYLKM